MPSRIPPKTVSPIFLVLSTFYVTCLLLSNLIASKVILLAGLTLDAAVILFPLTYILGDVFTEIYGFRRTKLTIWLGFSCNFLAALVYLAAVYLPYPDYWPNQEAFATVLGITPRIFIASLVGYLFGEFSNSIVLSKLKVATNGKKLWLRTILSTIVGEALDTVLFVLISFSGILPKGGLLSMILCQYVFKVGYEVLFTPFTYWCIAKVKKLEGLDVYDHHESYRVL